MKTLHALLFAFLSAPTVLISSDAFHLLLTSNNPAEVVPIFEQAEREDAKKEYTLYYISRNNAAQLTYADNTILLSVEELLAQPVKQQKRHGLLDKVKGAMKETQEKVKTELKTKAQEQATKVKETLGGKATELKEKAQEKIQKIIGKEPDYWKKIKNDPDVQEVAATIRALAGSTEELNEILAIKDDLEKQQEFIVALYSTIFDWLTTNPRMLSKVASDRIDSLKNKAQKLLGKATTGKLSGLFDRFAAFAKGEKLPTQEESAAPASSKLYSDEELKAFLNAFAKPL